MSQAARVRSVALETVRGEKREKILRPVEKAQSDLLEICVDETKLL